MSLLGHETEANVHESAQSLTQKGPAARRLLAEVVEHQGCNRTSISKSAQALGRFKVRYVDLCLVTTNTNGGRLFG